MRALVLVLAAFAVLAGSAAAAQRALQAMASDAPLTTDATAPLFALRGLKPGDRASRCITVRGAERHALFAKGGEFGRLAPHVKVRVFRGCSTDHLLFEGPLDRLPRAERALEGRGAYRIEAEVLPSAPQAAAASTSFGIGAQAEPADPVDPVESPAPCSTLTLARSAGGKLVRRATVSRRVRATLILRVYGGSRIVLTTGLRVRGKTLKIERWAKVAYAVNDAPAVTLSARPFRLRSRVGVLTSGANRVDVTMRPRRGKAVRARFRIDLRRGAQRACEAGR